LSRRGRRTISGFLCRNAGENHRQFDVGGGCEAGDQVKKLEDKPDLVTAQTGQLFLLHERGFVTGKGVRPGGGAVQAAQEV